VSDWWASLKHGGLLLSPSRLQKYFGGSPAPLDRYTTERLRAALTRLDDAPDDAESQRQALDVVFERICGLASGWTRGAQVDARWSRRAATGESVRPRRLWQGPHGATLPVFVDIEPRLGVGRGRRVLSRVVEWLRAGDERLALVTNHRQLRLVFAGLDYDAWAEWDTKLWFEAGETSAQVDALRMLIAPATLVRPADGQPTRLLTAIEESRRGQSELSAELGERVRRAVELLIQAHGDALASLGGSVSNRDIYIAATRMVMRLIVVLFAEARELLPREAPAYFASYGLQGLRDVLDRSASGVAAARLKSSHAAWPRIVALCQLIYDGSHHPELTVPRYGGALFAPGDALAVDPVSRAVAMFEDRTHAPSDATVASILSLLAKTEMRVRQGGATRTVSTPVDFADLSSEYIGILYEGLLDYELKRTTDDAIVFLNVGDQPALPLGRLEKMTDEHLKPLVEKLGKSSAPAVGEDADDGEGEPDDDEAGEPPEDAVVEPASTADIEEAEEVAVEQDAPEVGEDAPVTVNDMQSDAQLRAQVWAERTVKVGGLVSKPRSKAREAQAAYDTAVSHRAKSLLSRIVLPGEWYLVRWGGTRKGAGTFYTRPQLAVPAVQRTLRPLAFDRPSSGEDAPAAEWMPKKPEAILALRVCDPAVGSGSFAVASLRFLTDALWRSVLHNRWIVERDGRLVVTNGGAQRPRWFAECVRDLPLDTADPEAFIIPRLKRLVVERCIYGVDIDPLAIELARLALWVETMDRTLPFEFLDHKLKTGNSLVGAWFDRVQDYPVLAWDRRAGDEDHDRFVHHVREYTVTRGKHKGQTIKSGDPWAAALKAFRDGRLKPSFIEYLAGQRSLFTDVDGQTPTSLHSEARELFEELHQRPVHDTDGRARFYKNRIEDSPAFQHLRERFDAWCALWFWPADRLDVAPLPTTFDPLTEDARAIVSALRERHRFFHWELAFPDVFSQASSGFDAMVGNPPWEIQKPNSKEFFSNIDPLYRTFGKQEALAWQREYFERSADDERNWLTYVAGYKALSNWNGNVGSPFGDGLDDGKTFGIGQRSALLYSDWLSRRETRGGYADPRHPFVYQGSADINTYKMFVELAHALLRAGGRFGMLVPSGIYSDKGSARLRSLLLDRNQWEAIYAFQNERFVFGNVHHSFKIALLWFEKGDRTRETLTRFRLGPGDSPEAQELPDDILTTGRYLPVRADSFAHLSPRNRALLETRCVRDLEILQKIYAHSVLLGDQGSDGWGIRYATEFHMTNDSKLFPPRSWWESRGYQPDEYGRWIKLTSKASRKDKINEVGWVRLGDDSGFVHENDIEDVSLPLYQGVMVWHFDPAFKRFDANGRGRWESNDESSRRLVPKYLMSVSTFAEERANISLPCRLGFRDIAATTNQRTMVSAVVPAFPCGNKVPLLITADIHSTFRLEAFLNSLVFDYVVRQRGAGSLNPFALEELPLPIPAIDPTVAVLAARLNYIVPALAPAALLAGVRGRQPVRDAERLRLKCQLDAVVAEILRCDRREFAWVLRDCDHPVERVCNKPFSRSLDPKGFWRVEKEKDPELRHTVLALVAFDDLQQMIEAHGGDRDSGIQAFCNQNAGDGWMLPETLRLADYGLGHDDRAKQPQPVASRLGPRFLPWQLEMSVEESWAECERHARTLLGEDGFARLKAEIGGERPYPEVRERAAETAGTGASQQTELFPRNE
jgi:hypothetical protein